MVTPRPASARYTSISFAPAPTTALSPSARIADIGDTSTISRPSPEDQPAYEWPPLRIATGTRRARA